MFNTLTEDQKNEFYEFVGTIIENVVENNSRDVPADALEKWKKTFNALSATQQATLTTIYDLVMENLETGDAEED